MARLQTIEKISPILDLFTVERPEWGVREVATAVGIPRSSAHAVLASLVQTGLLHCRARGRYRIGWRVVELAEALRGSVDVRSCAAPHLEELVDRFGETTHLAALERGQVLYLDKVHGTHNVSVQGAQIGSRRAPHCTALGKALLAQLCEQELDRIVDQAPLRRFTPSTITDPGRLRDELARSRSAGHATDLGESVHEVNCVAAAIRDDLGSVVAAVSMSVPVSRFRLRKDEMARAVVDTARAVSRSLVDVAPGGTVPAQPLQDVTEAYGSAS